MMDLTSHDRRDCINAGLTLVMVQSRATFDNDDVSLWVCYAATKQK